MITKIGREISAENTETIHRAHDHVVAATKYVIKAHDHLMDNDVERARKFIIKAHKMGKAALGHLRDLLSKAADEEESDEEARQRKEEDEDESGSTGLNPYSSAASEYDHMRSGGIRVLTPEFYAIEKRLMGADQISVVGTPSVQTFLIDEEAISKTLTQSLQTAVRGMTQHAAARAINRAKGRVD